MISEKELASGFSAFWADCLPFLTPQTIAEFNLLGEPLVADAGGVVKPLPSLHKASNDITAEAAFGLFLASVDSGVDVLSIAADQQLIAYVTTAALGRVKRTRESLDRYWSERRRSLTTVNDELVELAKRLDEYFAFHKRQKSLIVQPRFKGCGILRSCYGDILASPTLYELKMVDRNLRGIDLRQVLIYAALNHESEQYNITNISVLNPRRGLEYTFALEELADRAARQTSSELCHKINNFLQDFESIHHAS
jgi:hypothetical protein